MAGRISKLSAGEVESGTGGTLVAGSANTQFTGVSIDSRTLQRGALFFAIRGPNQDGHRFIPDAIARGAIGIVAEPQYQYPGVFPAGRVLIRATDTHEALKYLGMFVRRRWPGVLVAVTGSMGKTTTREFTAQVMQDGFRVYQTPGNYNNLFGLPLALMGLNRDYGVGIFEMGMSAPGEIAEMCRIAAPVVGIIINVAPVHLEFFDSIKGIALAKAELADSLPSGGTLIFNADDPLVSDIAGQTTAEKISFGLSDRADIRADGIEITGVSQTRFRLTCDGVSLPAAIPFAGAHYVMNALPGIALGRRYGIPIEMMIRRLKNLQAAAMRGQILRFSDGFTIIDDSYNSNPRALMQMIEVLSNVPSYTRRILVAGEMLELGKDSEALHSECGVFASGRQLDMVIGIQGAARALVRAAVESGLPDAQTHFFTDAAAAKDFIYSILRPGDLLLIKGSRGVHTEKIIQDLCSHFSLLNA